MSDDEVGSPIHFGLFPQQEDGPWARLDSVIHAQDDTIGTSWVQAKLYVREGYDERLAAFMMAVTLLETAGAPQNIVEPVVDLIMEMRKST